MSLVQGPDERWGWDVVVEFRIEDDDITESDARRQIWQAVVDNDALGFMVGHADIEIRPHMVSSFVEGEA